MRYFVGRVCHGAPQGEGAQFLHRLRQDRARVRFRSSLPSTTLRHAEFVRALFDPCCSLAEDWETSVQEAENTLERWYSDRPEVKIWQVSLHFALCSSWCRLKLRRCCAYACGALLTLCAFAVRACGHSLQEETIHKAHMATSTFTLLGTPPSCLVMVASSAGSCADGCGCCCGCARTGRRRNLPDIK